ncbi:SRPBCC family protein [Anaerolineales bacterium]
MSRFRDSIEVNVPIAQVYQQWIRFESFPHFIEGVQEVIQIDNFLHWRVNLDGQETHWETELTEQSNNHRIVWESLTGLPHRGMLNFYEINFHKTAIDFQIDYELDGFIERIPTQPDQRLCNLKHFKYFIETGGEGINEWKL